MKQLKATSYKNVRGVEAKKANQYVNGEVNRLLDQFPKDKIENFYTVHRYWPQTPAMWWFFDIDRKYHINFNMCVKFLIRNDSLEN